MPLQFIDLFAGLGGFHLALEGMGHECVFASELKDDLRKIYNVNFPNTPIYGDITQINPAEIPPHDVLCAGFPCQPFSQAGKRQGFADEKERGNLFDNICEIVDEHKPRFIFLENVSNLKGHDKGNTWKTIKQKLDDLDYWVDAEILSPHQFGIPQHRRRIYIVCVRKDYNTLDAFHFPEPQRELESDITTIIDSNETKVQKLKPDTRNQLSVWQEFIDLTLKHGDKIPTFPIWAMEFGADYEFEQTPPAFQTIEQLQGRKGKLGKPIIGSTVEELVKQLPNYAQTAKDEKGFPNWKIRYIQQNRDFYKKHKSWLDNWIKKIERFDNSHLKLEWNCGQNTSPIIETKIVQFRASGIRVKLPTFSPALNLVGTQIPIFPWVTLPSEILSDGEPNKGRYMTVSEAAKLQGMQSLKYRYNGFELSQTRTFEALGNAVNVNLIQLIAQNLLTL